MNTGPFTGLRVLVTRAANRAASFADKLEAGGGHAILFPVIEIVGRAPSVIAIELDAFRTAKNPLFVFVSRNAVEHGLQTVTEIFSEPGILSTAAVGPATAGLLSTSGCVDVIAPTDGNGSEALLERLADIDLEGRQIIILRGESGREKLANVLVERGAKVAQLSVYARKRPVYGPDDADAALLDDRANVVAITSVGIYENLNALLSENGRKRLQNMPLLVPSRRAGKMIGEQGARGTVILAAGADDDAMLAALSNWQRQQGATSHDKEQAMSETGQPEAEEQKIPGENNSTSTSASSSASTGEATEAAESEVASDSNAGKAAGADDTQATQTENPAATVIVEKKSGGGIALLALLLALLAAAGTAYQWWISQNPDTDLGLELSGAEARTAAQLSALRKEIASQDDQLSDLLSDQQVMSAKAADIDAMNVRMQAMAGELEAMRGVSAGARRNWLMAEAAYYLQAANASLQLNRNVESAQSALAAADDRLASLADPSLLAVRNAIASERQALGALPNADTTGMALTLGNLAARAGELSTKTDNPGTYATPGQPTAEEEDGGGIERARRVLGDAVKSLVTVRRTDQQASALLAPKEEFFLARNLELQLLTARVALLNEQPELFRQSIDTSLEWLHLFFDPEAAEVQSALTTLEQLKGAAVRRELPDISGSLVLLRAAQSRVQNGASVTGGEQ